MASSFAKIRNVDAYLLSAFDLFLVFNFSLCFIVIVRPETALTRYANIYRGYTVFTEVRPIMPEIGFAIIGQFNIKRGSNCAWEPCLSIL